MPLFRHALLFLGVLSFTSCSNVDSNTSEAGSGRPGSSQEKVREGLDELQGLITVPAEPEELLWTEEVLDDEAAAKLGQKSGTRRLLAVFRFEPGTTDDFAPMFSGVGVAASMEVEDWFPAELNAQGQAGGGGSVKGTAVGADRFFKPPYSQGRLIRIDGSSFYILELFAQ